MKRLIRKASDMTLYHGTSFDNLLEIISTGAILPNKNKGGWHADVVIVNGEEITDLRKKMINDNFWGFVFLATDIQRAMSYTLRHIDNEKPGVILEIANIPTEDLLPDDTDCPSCKNWEESSSQTGQVKVSGEIDNSHITNVHFVNEFEDIVLTANLNNCIEEYEKNKHLFAIDYNYEEEEEDFSNSNFNFNNDLNNYLDSLFTNKPK